MKKKYVVSTKTQEELKDFLDDKILTLTRRLRPREYKKMLRIHQPSSRVLEGIRKRPPRSNVAILIQRGMIGNKIPDKTYIGLEQGFKSKSKGARAAAAIGQAALTLFAAKTLGLMPTAKNYTPMSAYAGIKVTELTVTHSAISFELPKVDLKPINESIVLEVYDSKGKKIRERVVPVINPMGDIAAESVAEDSAARYLRTGIRVAAKHIGAIASSIATYKLTEGQWGKLMAKSAALVQYLGLSKGIAGSEKADTRFWSTLPDQIRLVNLSLPAGSYQLKIRRTLLGAYEQTQLSKDIGKLEVKKGRQKQVLSFRI